MKNFIKIFSLVLLSSLLLVSCFGENKAGVNSESTGKNKNDMLRMADLKNIQAYLETYYIDAFMYPKENSNGCLSDKDGNVSNNSLKMLFDKEKAPLDPDKTHINAPCNIPGVYAYKTLEKDGLKNGGYILFTTLENEKGNTSENIDFSKKDYDYYMKNIGVETNSNIYSILN